MAMNMACISPSCLARGRDRNGSRPMHDRILADAGWPDGRLSMAGSGPTGSPNPAMTPLKKLPRPGHALALGSARYKEECAAVRDGVGVLDLPGFSRFSLSGEGAAEWLRTRIAGALPKAGRMTLGYFPDDRGRIRTEMSILRKGEDDFCADHRRSGPVA